MQWVTENWLILLLGGGMVAMHLFGHKHGHKGGNHNHRSENANETETPHPDDPKAPKENTDA